VPLVIIPQLLFAGVMFPIANWDGNAVSRVGSRLLPSFALQRLVDTSLVWNEPTEHSEVTSDLGPNDHSRAFKNLDTSLWPAKTLLFPSAGRPFFLDEAKMYDGTREPDLNPRRGASPDDPDQGYSWLAPDERGAFWVAPIYRVNPLRGPLGEEKELSLYFRDFRPATYACVSLALWMGVMLLVAKFQLRGKR
jgi:hypothetical protein